MNTLINNLTDNSSEQTLPWYRYGWPWFLISIPFVSITLGGVMLYLALQTNNSMVVDDYYKQGKAINVRIERDRVASLLGIVASVQPSSEGLVVQMRLIPPEIPESLKPVASAAANQFHWPETLELRWIHITQAERDGKANLIAIGGNRYIAQDASLPAQGKYRVHIQAPNDASWRLISDLQDFDVRRPIELSAQAVDELFNQSLLN